MHVGMIRSPMCLWAPNQGLSDEGDLVSSTRWEIISRSCLRKRLPHSKGEDAEVKRTSRKEKQGPEGREDRSHDDHPLESTSVGSRDPRSGRRGPAVGEPRPYTHTSSIRPGALPADTWPGAGRRCRWMWRPRPKVFVAVQPKSMAAEGDVPSEQGAVFWYRPARDLGFILFSASGDRFTRPHAPIPGHHFSTRPCRRSGQAPSHGQVSHGAA